MLRSIYCAFLILMFISLFSCQNRGNIKIGFSGPLTGNFSDLGVQGRNGAQLAVEDINEKGSIRGRRLELIAVDDTSSPEGAIQADLKLIDQGVIAIIGHMTSALSMAVYETLKENKRL